MYIFVIIWKLQKSEGNVNNDSQEYGTLNYAVCFIFANFLFQTQYIYIYSEQDKDKRVSPLDNKNISFHKQHIYKTVSLKKDHHSLGSENK